MLPASPQLICDVDLYTHSHIHVPLATSWLHNFITDTLVWCMVWPTCIDVPMLDEEFMPKDSAPVAHKGYGYLAVNKDAHTPITVHR